MVTGRCRSIEKASFFQILNYIFYSFTLSLTKKRLKIFLILFWSIIFSFYSAKLQNNTKAKQQSIKKNSRLLITLLLGINDNSRC